MTNVANPDDAQAAVECAEQTFGALHFAVNNAGIGGGQAPIGEVSQGEWEDVIDVNLNGVAYGLRYQIPAILAAGGGAIVNTSSILGLVGEALRPAYVASKHAVTGLNMSAALASSGKGIGIAPCRDRGWKDGWNRGGA